MALVHRNSRSHTQSWAPPAPACPRPRGLQALGTMRCVSRPVSFGGSGEGCVSCFPSFEGTMHPLARLVVPASATPIPPSGVTSPTAPCLWPLLPPCIRTLAIIAAHLGDEGNPPVSDLNCISSAHSLLLGKGTQPQALEKHILGMVGASVSNTDNE